ncbi:MAG TPA: MFS transporter [Chloroflexia bacterium]|nr:MFS transporter [Chloroflexia bacterium]
MNILKRNHHLLILGFAESVSGVGNWITTLAIYALIVFRGSGDVLESSGVLLAGLGPMLLCSPVAGWLCDRFDRKRLMIASEVLSGLVVAGLIFTTRLELIYALLALQAMAGSIMTPARQSSIPALVGRADLTRANALLQQLSSLVKIGAPILAGGVLTVLSPHAALVLDVVSFALSALILSRLPALPPAGRPVPAAAAPATKEVPALALAAGLRAAPRLRLLLGTGFAVTLTIMGFDVLSPVFTRDVLRGGESLFGTLIGLIGLGSVVSAAGLFWRKGSRDPWADLVLGLALLGVVPLSMTGAALLPDPAPARWLVMAGCLVGGLGNGLISVQAGTLLQTLAPAGLLGRVSGLFQSMLIGGQLVAIVLTPLLVPLLMPAAAYLGLSGLALLALAGGTALLVARTAAPAPELA